MFHLNRVVVGADRGLPSHTGMMAGTHLFSREVHVASLCIAGQDAEGQGAELEFNVFGHASYTSEIVGPGVRSGAAESWRMVERVLQGRGGSDFTSAWSSYF